MIFATLFSLCGLIGSIFAAQAVVKGLRDGTLRSYAPIIVVDAVIAAVGLGGSVVVWWLGFP